jgi:hypothetical protein
MSNINTASSSLTKYVKCFKLLQQKIREQFHSMGGIPLTFHIIAGK